MSMSFGLGVNLGQSQKLTPQMQQAIKLLQMSSLELEQEVQAKLDANPLLERVDEGEDITTHATPTLEDWSGNTWEKTRLDSSDGFDEEIREDSLDKMDSLSLDDDAMDMGWQEVYGDDVDGFNDYGTPAGGDDDFDAEGATSLSIQDHVRWQMNFKRLSTLDKLIAEHLIDAMDDMGFVRLPLEDVAKNFDMMLSFYEIEETVGVEEVQAVLRMIQSCSPTGVGARDLVECLLLQLAKLPFDTECVSEARLVLGSANHLQANNIKELQAETGLTLDEIKGAVALIRTLEPNPAEQFLVQAGAVNQEREVPDILVFAKDAKKRSTQHSQDTECWRVLLNPETLPRLQINQEYASMIKRGDETPDNQYLKNNLMDARLFIRSIEERNQNLLRVASCIVQKQQAFLLEGAVAMQPLTLREVAEAVDLHESTVSRLTTNKTMLTPQGVHSLKYFFSSHVSSDDGEVSSTAISAMVKEMIDGEDARKPLSDSELTRRLEEKGVTIARRTVTKYREAMNIGSSTQRKQKL